MISFAMPWLLLLLPLAWLVRIFVKPATSSQQAAIKVPFLDRITALQHQQYKTKPILKHYKILLAYLIWILIVIAAAGPEWLGAPIQQPQNGRNIMLVVDLSGSMQIPDMVIHGKPVNRLVMVKAVGDEFIKRRVGDRLGLVLFGSKPYLQTPLTFDRKTVAAMLDDATIGLAGEQTAIGDAVGLAIKSLQAVPEKSRVIVLLTDGGNNAGILPPLQAAELATQEGIKIYTIGIGADQLVIPSVLGKQVVNPSADLDEGTLKKMAEMTGGLYFRAKDTQGLEKAYKIVDEVEPVQSDAAILRPTTTLFQWPLALALLLILFLLFQRVEIKREHAHE